MSPRRRGYTDEYLDPEKVISLLKKKFRKTSDDMVLREHRGGAANGGSYQCLWVRVEKQRFLDMVDTLMEIDFPHFQITSGDDIGDAVELNYHFSIFRSVGRGKRLGVTVSVVVPKDDLVMPSLWERIPGTEYSEREIREMFGVDFDGLPNKGLVFLPEDWDEDIKPWRRDETGPKPEDIRELS